MVGETREAKLIYNTRNGTQTTEVQKDTFATETDVYGNEYYLSFQSGVTIQHAFKVSQYDFEETYHVDATTQKAKYASQILYNGAKYDIIRYQSVKNDEMLLLCR